MTLEQIAGWIGFSSILGATAWGARVESRLKEHDTLFIEREKLAQERHVDLKQDLIEIKQALKEKL